MIVTGDQAVEDWAVQHSAIVIPDPSQGLDAACRVAVEQCNGPWVVVHGHTPVRQPQLLTNRIGIDTGAFATGRLTCAALEDGDRRLLVVSGRPI